MTGIEKIIHLLAGGIIWDRGGNFSKFIDRENHRGTWTGCIY